jgi:ribosomal protein S18 acetylase RimI-like enzyme
LQRLLKLQLNGADGRHMRIRPFERADIGPLTEIVQATKVFRGEEIAIAVELMEIAAKDQDQKDYYLFSVVDETERVMGYYCIGPTPMTKATFDLYWIAVDPQSHGKGIGHGLLQHCEEQVKKMNGSLIVVETSSQPKYEPTRRFYLRHQYDESARIKDYYAQGDDLVIYTKHI